MKGSSRRAQLIAVATGLRRPRGGGQGRALVPVGTGTRAGSAVDLARRFGDWLVPPTQYADFLPRAQAIAEREATPLARVLIVSVAFLFLLLLFWAAMADVEQVATAPGVVRPAGKVKIVNHPDGGRVAQIHVTEGQHVRVSQPLISLDPELIKEEIAKRTNDWHSSAAEVARLQAEAGGTQPEFPAALVAARPDLVATQTQLFNSRRQKLASQRTAADTVIEQRRRDVAGLEARKRQLTRSLKLLKKQEAAISKLADKGYFPRVRFLSIQRQVSDLEGQLAEATEAVRGARSALNEAMSLRSSVDEDWRTDVLTRLSAAQRERDRLRSSLVQEEARLRNLLVLAPTEGIVQNLAISAPGQAIRPNEPLLNIVPSGAKLVVEARVSNDDIGYIAVGQEATVKIRTYDFVRFGTLKGVVETIAPDATEDPVTRQMMFTVTIRADRAYLGDRPGRFPVNPGMEAEVDLRIGERSILSYLTDRLSRTSQSTFRER